MHRLCTHQGLLGGDAARTDARPLRKLLASKHQVNHYSPQASDPVERARSVVRVATQVIQSALGFWGVPPLDHVPIGQSLQDDPPRPGRHTASQAMRAGGRRGGISDEGLFQCAHLVPRSGTLAKQDGNARPI